jgi:hypothetical protein
MTESATSSLEPGGDDLWLTEVTRENLDQVTGDLVDLAIEVYDQAGAVMSSRDLSSYTTLHTKLFTSVRLLDRLLPRETGDWMEEILRLKKERLGKADN